MTAKQTLPILSRDDLSFTTRDGLGRMTNWPQNNPGIASDWQKGIGFFEGEIGELAEADETQACEAIACALLDMRGRTTCLEIGFIDALARAAVLGLRAMRNGSARFEPVDADETQGVAQ